MDATLDLRLQNLRSKLRGPFDVVFEAGRCSVLSGPSGIGKSLLLRMIADLDPNDGDVWLGAAARRSFTGPQWRRLVTYVAAETGWWGDRVGEHMTDVKTARRLMGDVGLDPMMLEAPVAQLSTGERQRAALVRGMVGQPRFLLLDEPTSALDEHAKLLVEAALARLTAAGVGLIVVSHDAAQGRRMGNRWFAMTPSGLQEASP